MVITDHQNDIKHPALKSMHEPSSCPPLFPLFTDPFGGFLVGKELTCQHRKCRFDSWLGRSLGEGHGNPFQYSCLGNPMDREAWWATVHGLAKSQVRLSNSTTTNVVLVSGAQQSDSVIHVYLFLFQFFSHLGYYRILSRVLCAI